MKLLFSNVNGYRSVLKKTTIVDNVNKADNTFENFAEKYDIICLNEIKMCKTSIDKLDADILPDHEYKYYNVPRTKKGYSGVAIFSKYEPVDYSTEFYDNDEGRYIHLEFDEFYIICVYKPNAGPKLDRLDYKDEFDKLFQKRVKSLSKKKEVIICGDMNAIQYDNLDTYDFDKHHNKLAGVTDTEIDNLNKLIDEKNIYNIFRYKYPNKLQYSYFSFRFPSRKHNKGLMIDYILCTKKLLKHVKSIKYENNIYTSDHLCVTASFDVDL